MRRAVCLRHHVIEIPAEEGQQDGVEQQHAHDQRHGVAVDIREEIREARPGGGAFELCEERDTRAESAVGQEVECHPHTVGEGA